MRLRTIGLAATLSTALFQTSSAVVRPKGADDRVVAAARAPRAHRTTEWSRGSQLTAVGLLGWTALWDRDTDVPVRLWGPATFTAGAMKDPAIAESAARQFLAQHLALLAPGSQLSDFVLVSNQLGGAGDVRSLGFQQLSGGVKVLGGAISFSFKNDRMIMVGSTALPGVHVATLAPARVDAGRLASSATSWLASAGFPVSVAAAPATATAIGADRVIVPMVHSRGAHGLDIEYRLAEQLVVESTQDEGRWNVWLDAATATPILRESMVQYASGKILFDVGDRYPTGARSPKPAPRARHTINGVATVAELDGSVTWAGTAPATVAPGLVGPLVSVVNKAGTPATDSLALAAGATLIWSKASDELGDAQLSSFVFAMQAKAFVHANIDPTLAWADTSLLPVNVNINQTCNANWNGQSVNFYRATSSPSGTQCQNTGRLADVVYHEYGHSVHQYAVIEGVGNIDGSVGEGMADVLAALITGDHGMGRGFFLNNEALRDLDKDGQTLRYPDDLQGEVHADGEIVGEAFWDMKKALIAKLGAQAGEAQARKIYYGIIQRSVDIPTTYVEALVADDNDGDLSNGTPNMCAINAGFGPHGLANAASSLGFVPPVRDRFTISFTAKPPAGTADCMGATITKASIEWKNRGGQSTTVELAAQGNDYSGVIPTQAEGTVVQYKVVVTLSDGSSISFPNNVADPYYEFYVGEVTKLWCSNFEAGAGGWTHGAQPANRDEWQVGPPQGLGGDPKTAFAGTAVFGIDLASDGVYRSSSMTWAESPEIDLMGHTDVRLQYQRWLGVEDGVFDTARIMVNGVKMWTNFASPAQTMQGVDFVDKEWRFQDIALTSQAATGKVKLRFELDSDPGLNYGGWTMDDVCVVAAAPAPTCGNGSLDEGETCDDGNLDDGDGCSPTCSLPGDDTGCCSVGATPGGAALLSLFTLGMLIRRRRFR